MRVLKWMFVAGLIAQGTVWFLAAFLLLITDQFGVPRALLLLAFVTLAPLAAGTALYGGSTRPGRGQRALLLALAAVQLVLVAELVLAAASEAGFGFDWPSAVLYFGLALGVALLGLTAVVLAAIRGMALVGAVALAVVPLAGLGASTVMGVTKADCRLSSFQRSDFRPVPDAEYLREGRTRRQKVAHGLERCGDIQGLRPAEVESRLGRRDSVEQGKWLYELGLVGEGLGPGDDQTLYVSFGRRDRVRGSWSALRRRLATDRLPCVPWPRPSS